MLFAAVLGAVLLLPSCASPRRGSSTAARRMAGVKEAFNHAWTGYRQHAFPHDELHPVSDGYGDSR